METYEKAITSKANFHLAGIVPVAGGHTSLELPFPDVMLPIANDYTLLEAAIEIAIGKITALPAPKNKNPNIANVLEFDNTTKNTPKNMKKRLPTLIKMGPNLFSKLSPKNLTKA